jgi:hypothetical protein
MKYGFSTTPIGQNQLRLIMNTLTFDFLDLKNKVLFNKTNYSIGIIQMEEAFVPQEYEMEVTNH